MEDFNNIDELINYVNENVNIKYTNEDIEEIKKCKEKIIRYKYNDNDEYREFMEIKNFYYYYKPNKYITLFKLFELLKSKNILTKFLTQFINHIINSFSNEYKIKKRHILDLYSYDMNINHNMTTYQKRLKFLVVQLCEFINNHLCIYNVYKYFDCINKKLYDNNYSFVDDINEIYNNFNSPEHININIVDNDYDFIKDEILEFLNSTFTY